MVVSMFQRIFVAAIVVLCVSCPVADAADRPNILWITAEDMSPALGCYGDTYAVTPNIDRLAEQSVRYTHAFATAPVCSPVRSTLISGCYAPSLGTHNMRSGFRMPEHIRGFPAWLRDAGYYTTNNVKTDYNTASLDRLIRESWHESSVQAHWRGRADRQPFFAVFNLMTSHQSRSMVWPYERFQKEVQAELNPAEIHDPDKASLPPYYPDTPVIRRDWARFYDCVTAMDRQVGRLLKQLAEDELDGNTIVFFFSDHGSGMPRHKRALLDTGMHVPLLIRFPDKWKHLAPGPAGSVTDRLVSFVDFPATVLNLAGVQLPDYFQGQPFLGDRLPPERRFAFGHRDRVDEAFDCARSVRGKRYLYIRNYMPHLSYHQPTAWPDQGQIRHEISLAADRETMTKPQWHYAGPTKPPEELYDSVQDPLNLNNLAGDADHADIRNAMRQELIKHQHRIHDRGFIPETILFARQSADSRNDVSRAEIHAAIDDANAFVDQLVGSSGNHLLRNRKIGQDYWRTMSFLVSTGIGSPLKIPEVSFAEVPDSSKPAAIEAAHALVRIRGEEATAALEFLMRAARSPDLNVVLHAMRTIELLGDKAVVARPTVEHVAQRCRSLLPTSTTATFVQSPEQDLAMFISFSANAFLAKHPARE